MATYSVDVYRQGGGIKLGSGTATGGSVSITSYTAFNPGLAHDEARRLPAPTDPQGEVQVVGTTAGASLGYTVHTRVLVDGGATLTLNDRWPFA